MAFNRGGKQPTGSSLVLEPGSPKKYSLTYSLLVYAVIAKPILGRAHYTIYSNVYFGQGPRATPPHQLRVPEARFSLVAVCFL